jgi:hypothetical protein
VAGIGSDFSLEKLVLDRFVRVAILGTDARASLTTDTELRVGDRHHLPNDFSVVLVDKFSVLVQGL